MIREGEAILHDDELPTRETVWDSLDEAEEDEEQLGLDI